MRLLNDMKAEHVKLTARGAIYHTVGEKTLAGACERASYALAQAIAARVALDQAEAASRAAPQGDE